MTQQPYIQFLQWALPRIGYRWRGFRKVRRQVIRPLRSRIEDLGLAGPEAYREFLEVHPTEWAVLDSFCRVTISRFFRDREVMLHLGRSVLPALAGNHNTVRVCSLGSASGEEPYSVSMLWAHLVQEANPDSRLEVTAVEVDSYLLARAREPRYPRGALKDVPEDIRRAAFREEDDRFCLREEYREPVRFVQMDVRDELPGGPYALVLCRNLPFTYFALPEQSAFLEHLVGILAPGAWVVLGSHEELPADPRFIRVHRTFPLWRFGGDPAPG